MRYIELVIIGIACLETLGASTAMPNVPSHDIHRRPALQVKPLPDVVALSVFDTILPIASMCVVSAINTPGVSDQITQEATLL